MLHQGLACSHTPHKHNLRPGVDSRCEACQRPMGVTSIRGPLTGLNQTRLLRTWREAFLHVFPLDPTVPRD